MPRSSALSIMAWLSSSDAYGPKFMVPRQRRETLRTVRPSDAYSMRTGLAERPIRRYGLDPRLDGDHRRARTSAPCAAVGRRDLSADELRLVHVRRVFPRRAA